MADRQGATISALPNVLLWGGRSQARLISAMLAEAGLGRAVLVFDSTLQEPYFQTEARFLNDAGMLRAELDKVSHYVVCIGAEHGYARVRTAESLERLGLRPLAVVHSESFIDPSAVVGTGCQIMPFAVVHKFAVVGEQAVLNTSCTVDHECVLGRGVHVMGSAAIAGKVRVGDFATIGTNATVLPSVTIGEGAYVGAGAVVREDVEPFAVVAGVPARPLRRQELRFDGSALSVLLGE